MQQNKISILSTRPIDESLIKEAKRLNIEIDVLSFIETGPTRSIEVQQKIENALLKSSAVVFTSMNAVDAVANEMDGQRPDWKIYSIGNTTKQLVKKYFGEESIAGTADSAAALAELIAEEYDSDEIFFFCGDQRRDELPDILRSNDIPVNEIVVYQTIPVKHKIEKTYYGILFFSPSAVESLFSNNKVPDQTILFAIGNTTANEIKKYSNNKIIIGDEPGKENLVKKMIRYYTRTEIK
ncbi:MAG: uroporphyrinogen-III synthase [Chitinophagaceae bacterium]|nr:MAG: uroporphyrinogen-III synthase [Chitinophagaceae bacterium]